MIIRCNNCKSELPLRISYKDIYPNKVHNEYVYCPKCGNEITLSITVGITQTCDTNHSSIKELLREGINHAQ